MSAFMQELLEIALEVMREVDKHDISPPPERMIRLSWKTNDDPDRPSRRAQPVIIELHEDFMVGRELPEHVPPKIRKQFAAFIRQQRARFKPRTTENPHQSHTVDRWVFPPEG